MHLSGLLIVSTEMPQRNSLVVTDESLVGEETVHAVVAVVTASVLDPVELVTSLEVLGHLGRGGASKLGEDGEGNEYNREHGGDEQTTDE